MAKKKRARRRVGARSLNAGSPMVKLLAVGAGYLLAADPINSMLDGVLSKVFKKPATTDASGTTPAGMTETGSYVAIGAEGFAAYMLLKKKTMLPVVAGGLLAGAGLKRALKKFGVISGYRVNGYQNVPVIGSYQNVPVIGNGIAGYNVNGRRASAVMGNAVGSGSTSGSDMLR